MRLDGFAGMRLRQEPLGRDQIGVSYETEKAPTWSRTHRTKRPDTDLPPVWTPSPPRRKLTDEELLAALKADMQRLDRDLRENRPLRRRMTNARRVREREYSAGQAEAKALEAARMRDRRKSKRWTEKRPGQLARIRARLRLGDASGLGPAARRMLVLIARRPDVVTSRKWTTAKASRVTVNEAMVRSHFHHWAASVLVNAAAVGERLKVERAAAELKRQEDEAYASFEAAFHHEQREQERLELREQERLYQRGLPPAVDDSALARLVDRGKALREDARLEAIEMKELNDVPDGPWLALNVAPPDLRVLDGCSVPE